MDVIKTTVNIAIAALLALILASCASSGSKFTTAQANQVKNGMSRERVIEIMRSKPYSVSEQGKVLIWSYAKYNGFTGGSQSRSAKFSFDAEGMAYGIPEGGVYGDAAKYQ